MIASDLFLKFIETQGSDAEVLTSLEIKNVGKTPIERGWRLYFSLGLTPLDESLFMRVLVDGRYGYLEPTSNWQPLAPGDTRQIQVENWLFSGMHYLDRQGFFLTEIDDAGGETFLGEPRKGSPDLQPLTVIRNASIPAMTPGVRTCENPPPPSVPAANTIIPSPRDSTLSGETASVDALGTTRTIDPELQDAYQLEITKTGIAITAQSEADAFLAEQSLQQLRTDSMELPLGKVVDSPGFEHRALFIDIARHFHNGAQLKKVINAMARYKMNRLQLGISNDEGWRLQISDLPELTDIGAKRSWRGPLYPSWGDGPEEVAGFLKRDEFIDLLQFAATKHIRIIPEFNLPGHANALLRSFDASDRFELIDPNDTSEYRSAQGYKRNVLNVGMPDSYRLAEHIIADIKAMYDEAGLPMSLLHLGGDEVPHGAWLQSPACHLLPVWQLNWDMTEPEDQAAATATLMAYHYEQMLRIVERVSPGTQTGFWHEMALHGDARSYYNVWLTDAGDRAALDHILKNRMRFVISNASHLYLDMPYAMAADEPGLPWANYIDTEDIFRFDPLKTWDLDDSAEVIGIQAQLWTETVLTEALMDYHLFPRLLAVAERGWNQTGKVDWAEFHSTMDRETRWLGNLGLKPRQ